MKMTLKQIREACAEARKECIASMRKNSDASWYRENCRCHFARAPRLLQIDREGNRINDHEYIEWKWRMSQINALIADPATFEIAVDSGVDFAASPQEYRDGIYEPEYFDVTVYERE